MKKITLFTLFFMGSVLAYSQTLKKEIIASAGTSFSSGTAISWTIGEPMIAAYSNTVDLFEGFYTPEEEINTSIQKLTKSSPFTLYPNPNNGVFQIELEAYQMPVHYTILNTNGMQIQQGYFSKNTRSFDIANIPAGVYYLSLKSNSISESISFVKL